jgi:hypothetical protein
MKKRLFPLLIALSALAVSGSAAFYSVFGLSKLFAGASTQVIIMAGSLEFAKLVVASLLYQYWDTINRALKIYLSLACFILILITSGGIYGFLSGAYQETATKSELLDKSLAILNQKQIRFEEQKTDLTIEKTQLNKSISELRVSLSNPSSVSYYDKEAEQVITTTSSSTRRALQKELENTIKDRDDVNIKLEAVLDSINSTDVLLLDKEVSNEAERELGPLKYLAETTGKPMNEVVNWFLLLIIFVFDPLAIALVVAANFAFAQIKSKKEEFIIQTGGISPKDVKMSKPNGLEFNTPYNMEEVSKAFARQDKKDRNIEEELYTEEDEKRMNVIGQNGNDGIHYDKEDNYKNLITTTKNLTEEEVENLSKEIAKTENTIEENPINPTKKELEKLAEALNINYSDENVDLDRLTDTTQTLINKVVNSKDEENKNTLKYEGRK